MTTMLIQVRQKVATIISTLVETYAREVGRLLEPRLRTCLKDGESLPDVALVLVLLGRLVARAADQVVKWDRVERDESDDDAELRLQRDIAARALRQKMIDVRALASALYGRRHGSVVLGFEGRLPRVRQPESLWGQARAVLDRLRNPNLETPANRFKTTFDPGQLARELETGATALRRSLDAVERRQRGADSTQAAKGEAMADLELVQKASVLVVKGFFTLAGRSELVRQLDESLRKKSP